MTLIIARKTITSRFCHNVFATHWSISVGVTYSMK